MRNGRARPGGTRFIPSGSAGLSRCDQGFPGARRQAGELMTRADLRLIASLIPECSRVLDLGCGNGELLRLREGRGCHGTGVEIEVDTLAQLDEAIAAGVERILLDNMDDETLKEAANRCHTQTAHPHTVYCEASGGIGFDRLKRVAQTGVDGIALGYLTHSSRSLDIGLDFVA